MPELDPSRRDVISTAAGTAAAAIAARAGAAARAFAPPAGDAAKARRGISSIHLQVAAARLDDMRRFYADVLQLPTARAPDGALEVRAGDTQLRFAPVSSGEPYYHFAFNIPENLLASAKRWLAPRCPLIRRPDGGDEYDFRSWNAHAVYFNDPAGNILEFIARHNLRNARDGEFAARDILYASEIALVVDDVTATVRQAAQQLGLDVFAGSISDAFAAVGDDHRLLIIVKRGREWNSGHGRTAEVWPVQAALRRAAAGPLESVELQYRVGSA